MGNWKGPIYITEGSGHETSGPIYHNGAGTLNINMSWAINKAQTLTVGSSASVYGSGYALTSTNTKAFGIYADDNNTLLGASAVRAGVFRTLITVSHSNETSIFGCQNQLKIKAPLDCTLTTGNRAGSWNYLEMAGTATKTLTLSGSAKATAGCYSMVEWDGVGSLTLSSGHNLSGFAALTNVVKTGGTFTQTGKFSAFTAMNNATASYSKFKFGLYLPMEAVEEGVRIGESSSTSGSGLPLTSSQTAVFRCHADDGGAALGASAVRGGVFRTLVTVSHSNEVSIFGCQNQLKIANPSSATLTTGNRAGSWNYLELEPTAGTTLTLSGADKITAGSFHMVSLGSAVATVTISSGHTVAAVAALTNITATGPTFTQTGVYAAFAAVNNSSANYSPFGVGLYFKSGAVTTAIDVTCAAIGAAGRIAKLYGTSAAANMTDGYGAVETDLTLTGTVAGYVAASSTWINMAASSSGGGQLICTRNDGIYVSATGTPMSSSTAIIGGRFHYIADGGGNPGALYLFSTNIYDNALTAIFHVNAAVDIAWVSGTLSGGTAGNFPIFRDVSAGVTHYVNTYTA